jgi:hypothetical protein
METSIRVRCTRQKGLTHHAAKQLLSIIDSLGQNFLLVDHKLDWSISSSYFSYVIRYYIYYEVDDCENKLTIINDDQTFTLEYYRNEVDIGMK